MQILQIFWDRRELFITCLLEHIRISLTAVLCAGILGILTGILISRHKKAAGVVLGIVNVIYTIPSISLLGFLIPLTGIGNRTAIIALTVYGLLPIVRNTYTGLTTVDATILEVAEGLGSDGRQMMFRIRFPLALPVIISGFRNMVVMIIAMGGIASFIGAGGLGVAIYRGITTYNMTLTAAGSILIALLALVSDRLLSLAEKAVNRRYGIE
ncbi:MAG: ABC transporter permease [Lachnospiraceae bacterium]|jgi:osmoprotectant transport system permease protein|nr:ABC transporter permease [Lachnospiraceae bacterium]MCI8987233.1 ABC transporter permease [Lachnospiraceae bacterium]MCI9013833.1 ABC transporter permease [Lachnospiraceae bacterium]